MTTAAPTASEVAKLNIAANDAAIAQKEALPKKTEESKTHRFRRGDQIEWEDTSKFPYKKYAGEVKGFDNIEGTYLIVEIDGKERVLTEDELVRVG